MSLGIVIASFHPGVIKGKAENAPLNYHATGTDISLRNENNRAHQDFTFFFIGKI